MVIIGSKQVRKITRALISNNINAIGDQFGGRAHKKALITLNKLKLECTMEYELDILQAIIKGTKKMENIIEKN